jgi:hypothetical protein
MITNLLEEPVVGRDIIKKLIDAEVHKRNEKKMFLILKFYCKRIMEVMFYMFSKIIKGIF